LRLLRIFFFWYSDRSVFSFVNASHMKEKKKEKKKKFKTKDMMMFINRDKSHSHLHIDKNHTAQLFEPKKFRFSLF